MEHSRFKRIKLMDVEVGEESVVAMEAMEEEDDDDYATLTCEAMVEELSPTNNINNNNNNNNNNDPKRRRGWGLVGRLANHPTLLHNNNALGGSEQREKLKELLLELQCGFDAASKRDYCVDDAIRAWNVDVKSIVYDIENLIEDLEFEDMAASASSSVWERQRMLNQYQDKFCGLPPLPSIEDRTGDVLRRLDYLKNTMYSLNLVIVKREGDHDHDHDHDHDDDDDDLDPSLFLEFQRYSLLPWYLKRCITYCGFMLPYTFQKDFVVSLWVSLGFVLHLVEGKEPEDVGSIYFDILLRGSFFSVDSIDDDNSTTCYRVPDRVVKSLPHDIEFFRLGGFHRGILTEPEKARHISLPSRYCHNAGLEYASKSPGLLSLLLVGDSKSSIIDHPSPYNLFLRLRYLRVLDLSWSNLELVPGYICDLVHLRYLDISFTRIKKLPPNLSVLFRLRTFRLLHCNIDEFPENFLHLINLRHLHFHSMATLISMPPYIGRLTLLQTLSEFIVSKAKGCSIVELGGLNNLRGHICISQLEHVESEEDAKEARLHLKECLDSLVLRWNNIKTEVANYSVIKGLHPHYNLRRLQINRFGGSQFPAWLSDPAFTNLVSVSLNNCDVNELPLLGHLPSIKNLELGGMHGIKRVQDEFWRSDTTKESFPLLQTLYIYEMFNLEEWGTIREGDFRMLQNLSIIFCPKLKNIPEQMISSQLVKLIISTCPELQSLSETGLPTTLQYLSIFGCPNLSNRYHREGSDRQKVAHIQDLRIDIDD